MMNSYTENINSKSNINIVDYDYLMPRFLMFCFFACIMMAYMYNQTKIILFSLTFIFIVVFILYKENDDVDFAILLGVVVLSPTVSIEIGASLLSPLLVVFPLYLLKNIIKYQKINLAIWCFPLGITGFIGIIHMITSNQGENGIVLIWCLSLMVYASFLSKEKLSLKMWPITFFYVLCVDFICLLNILKEIEFYGISLIPTMYSADLQFGSAYVQIAGANALTFQVILSIFLCIACIVHCNGVRRKAFCYIQILFFLYIGIILVERAFYIELIALVVLSGFLIRSSSNPFKGIFQVALLLIILVGGCVFFYSVLENPWNSIIARFNTGGDRNILYGYGLDEWTSNVLTFLFGEGILYSNSLSVSFMQRYTAHNIWIDYLLSVGLVGTFSFLATTLIAFKCRLEKHKIYVAGIIPLCLLFIHTFISGATRDVFIYFYLLFSILFMSSDKSIRSVKK